MLFAILLVCFFSIFIILKSIYNKHSIIMSLNFLLIALQGICLMIMLSKFSMYRYYFRIDYLVYFWMARIQIDLFTLKNIFTLTLSLSFVLNLLLIIDILPLHKKILLKIKFLVFVVALVNMLINSAEVAEYIFINKYIHSFIIWDCIDKIILFWNMSLHIGVCILSSFICYTNLKRTNIRFIKNYYKYVCLYNIVITGIRVWLFLYTPLKYYFCNHDILTFNIVSQIYDFNIFVIFPIALSGVCVGLAILFFRFKLYNVYNLFLKFKYKNRENIICNDINHIFHTYKNSLMTVIALQNKILKSDSLEESKQIAKDTMSKMINMADFIKKNIQAYDRNIMEWNEVDVKHCLDDAIETININYENIEINIKYDVNERYIITGCSESIYEMLFNILKNAVESLVNIENGMIKIELSKKMKWLCITVRDNGIGISKKNLKRIFNPFFSLKRNTRNWGIGLYQVKKTVEMHFGIIDVVSKIAKFTEFQILLPLNKNI